MPSQRLIVCIDGTWNRADPPVGVERTNAARIAQSLAPDGVDGRRQVVSYIEGIGTRGPIDVHLKAYSGHGIGAKIREAYLFLAQNWSPGDEICLFGVSRGAYAVRALSEWIADLGLLAPSELRRLTASWNAYRTGRPGPRAREAPIRIVGAFDMVDALGIPVPGVRRLTRPRVGRRDPKLASNVEAAFHALAFDERRKAFRPTLWTLPPGDERRLEQVWFAGSHGDICGGFGRRGLSDIALAWMLDRMREAAIGLNEELLAAELQPDLSLEPSPQRSGLHLLLPAVERRPLTASHESFHESWVRKVRDPNDPYGGPRAAQFIAQEGA